MTDRKFYRTVIQVEVLSETPLDDDVDLDEVYAIITHGDCSGQCKRIVDNEQVDGKTMAKLLEAQESDPCFFWLTEDGEDTEEYDCA